LAGDFAHDFKSNKKSSLQEIDAQNQGFEHLLHPSLALDFPKNLLPK
jgi:hypothetical protein